MRAILTNYLLQSVIGCSIFCGYGLACYYKLGITYAVLVGVAMVIAQYSFARFWFKNHSKRERNYDLAECFQAFAEFFLMVLTECVFLHQNQ